MSGETSRARLLALLGEACELEHALCCSYLFAAFSIRRDIGEGLDWRQQQVARDWASRIYHVAAQEMLHLAQAWNIMTACGGAPYYARPAFPQAARHFPLNIALSLRRFDAATMDRFIVYERPEGAVLLEAAVPPTELWPIDEGFEYDSVGELYGEIARIIRENDDPDLFIGDRGLQAGQALVDFYDILEVSDRRTALAAIERITEQGEGTRESREDSHFGVFRAIRAQLDALDFEPALPVADNPYVTRSVRQILVESGADFAGAGPTVTMIEDHAAAHAVDLFNDVYVAMLQALAHIFAARSGDPAARLRMARDALELMITVIKPLGEAVCRLPSGHEGLNAGPSFEIGRHVPLPHDSALAATVFGERLGQLYRRGLRLLEGAIPEGPRGQVGSAVRNLGRMAGLNPVKEAS
ncbi:MAG TPA: ferritin-like domain-containing protein [Allosphingosinicella sp.]|nr:ferritin-like domain-containing protein [Allosphingosinicella sp.]